MFMMVTCLKYREYTCILSEFTVADMVRTLHHISHKKICDALSYEYKPL
jgi:hypothetical protein